MMVTWMVWPSVKVCALLTARPELSSVNWMLKVPPDTTAILIAPFVPELAGVLVNAAFVALIGTPFTCICVIVASELPVFCPPRLPVQQGAFNPLSVLGHEESRVANCVFTPSFSYLEKDDVRPDAQNATAMPRATATAMRMTVAMTGDTAFLFLSIDVVIIQYRY